MGDNVAEEAGTETLPEAPATPGTRRAGEAVEVAPASLAAGVPAARPTLLPAVTKCIGATATESSEVVVQPGAMDSVADTWSCPSVIWLTRPVAAEQGTVTVTETVVDEMLLDGADVGAGLPGAGAVVVVV